MRIILKIHFLIFILFFLNGCGAAIFTGYEKENTQKSNDITVKNCNFEEVKSITYSDNDKLANIEKIEDVVYNGNYLGYKAFLCKEFNKSIRFFDLVEDAYKDVDETNILKKGATAGVEVLTNDNISSYDGKNYERILTNVYKGLSYLSLGNFDAARVEMNRARDRQRIIKDKYTKEIQKRTKDLKAKKEDFNKAQELISENVIIPEFKAYKDFSNPFVSYMLGLYRILDLDKSSASFFFKEVYSQEQKEIFLQDLAISQYNLSPKRKYKSSHLKNMDISANGKYIWMIFDNGFSKSFKDIKLTIPIPVKVRLVDENGNEYEKEIIKTVSFAIAGLKDGFSSYDYLSLNDKNSVIVSDMDSVITTEYKEALLYNVLKAMISTTAKTLASVKASSKNAYLGLAADIYNIASNHADVRYFVGIPKNYQVSRVPNKGSVSISTPNKEIIYEDNLDTNKNYLIYIKSPLNGVFYVNKIEGR